MSKVLILEGSVRKQGNTARLTAEFARGAKESGHTDTASETVGSVSKKTAWMKFTQRYGKTT